MPAAVEVAGILYYLTGGMSGPWLQMPGGCSARSPAAKSAAPRSSDEVAKSEVAADFAMPAAKFNAVDLAKRGEAEKKIEAALDAPTQLEFVNTPLSDVVDYLKKRHGIEIQLDKRALDDVGIGSDTPITKSLKGISLKSALRLILKEHGLTYAVSDEVLQITTPEEADARLETKVYPVADLLLPAHSTNAADADFDSLINLLKETIKPTTWDDAGGVGSISTIDGNGSLLVSQTQEVHEDVANVLEKLRTLNRQQGKEGQPMWKPLSAEERRARRAAAEAKGTGAGGGMMGGMGGMGPKGRPSELRTETLSQATAAPAPSEPARTRLAELGAEKSPKPATLGEKSAAAVRSLPPSERGPKGGEAIPAEPPIAYPDAELWGKLTAARKRLDFDRSLAGVRSLKIDVVQAPSDTDRVTTFRSLGVEPLLVVTLANRSRFDALAWGLALLVGLAGLAMTCRPAGKKTCFVFSVGLLATLVPLATESIEVAQVCNMVFYAAALLVPYYLVVGLVRWLFGACCRACAKRTARTPTVPLSPVASAVILMVILFAATVCAQSPATKPQAAANGPYVIQVVEPAAPVNVPEDAIILPYDPESTNGIKDADKLLVPYDRYVELWNRAHPDKKIETKARARALCAGRGGVQDAAGRRRVSAVDRPDGDRRFRRRLCAGAAGAGRRRVGPGRTRRQAGPAERGGGNRRSVSAGGEAASGQAPAVDRSLVVLHVSGKGRHKLELAVRLKLSRQGGWRVAEGVLPAAPATALAIIVPKPQTELRLGQVADRRSYETEKAGRNDPHRPGPRRRGEHPVAAEGGRGPGRPQPDGRLRRRARRAGGRPAAGVAAWPGVPPQPAGAVQRGPAGRLSAGKGRGQQRPRLGNPQDRPGADRSRSRCLQPAKDREQFTLRLWRAGTVGQGRAWRSSTCRWSSVADAALHNGQLTIRRSPLAGTADARTARA